MAELRIGTWNMAHRPSLWDVAIELAREHDLHALLLQEAIAPARLPSDWAVYPATESWTTWAPRPRKFCTAILDCGRGAEFVIRRIVPLNDPLAQSTHLAASHPGAFTVADVTVAGAAPVTLVSAYGLMDDIAPGSRTSYSITTLNRLFSDLNPLIDRRDRRLIVAGDFNSGTQPYQPRYDKWHCVLWDRIAAFGFTNCTEAFATVGLDNCSCKGGDACRHVRTQRFRAAKNPRPYQADYVLSLRGVTPKSCDPLNTLPDAEWAGDHCAVVATFDV